MTPREKMVHDFARLARTFHRSSIWYAKIGDFSRAADYRKEAHAYLWLARRQAWRFGI